MKIIFFGTSEFAATILKGLKDNFEVAAVVTQQDKPVGRKQSVITSPVELAARADGLNIFKFESLKSPDSESELRRIGADISVVASYGKIVPKDILSLTPLGAVNVHASLLPKYRGASPIQSAIKNGDGETGITIMLMDEYIDHGPILAQSRLSIGEDDTTPDLTQKLAILGQNLIINTLQRYKNGLIKPIQQEHENATLCGLVKKDDGKIKWNNSAGSIYNLYRAYFEWPGIWTKFNGSILKINKCLKCDFSSNLEPGTVFSRDNIICVECGSGAIRLTEVQLESKKSADINSFVRGHRNFIGSILG